MSQRLVRLRPDEVHLWLAEPDDCAQPALVARYLQLLSPDELLRFDGYRFERDRHAFLVTRALVRTALSRYRPIAPAAWRFAANAHGRPRIDLPGPALRVTFNVSHTDGLIAVAVADGRDVGVDVEKPCERHWTPLVQRCFAPDEKLAFAGIEAPLAALRFAELWTLKESYVKARGLGLTLPLDCCSFALTRDGIAAVLDERTADGADRWHFAQCRTASGHVLALCVAAGCAREVSIIARATVPFAHDEAIDLPIVRASRASVAGTGCRRVA